jgi:hypothetical protein
MDNHHQRASQESDVLMMLMLKVSVSVECIHHGPIDEERALVG